jgi:hypothetical protein
MLRMAENRMSYSFALRHTWSLAGLARRACEAAKGKDV